MTRAGWKWVAAVAATALVMAGAGVAVWRWLEHRSEPLARREPTRALATHPGDDRRLVGQPLPSLDSASAWLHGGPVPVHEPGVRATALLLWSDADPASLRMLETVLQWHRHYGRYGLRVILVHVAEYPFQTVTAVAASCTRLGVEIPTALDSGGLLDARLGSGGLPRLAIADFRGLVQRVAAAPLEPRACELAVRELLRRVGELPPPLRREPETWRERSGTGTVGLGTLDAAARPPGPLSAARAGETHAFAPVFEFQVERADGVPVPVGRWRTEARGLRGARGTAADYLAIRYHGRDVFLVMSAEGPESARLWVLQDDRWLTAAELGADARLDERGASLVVFDRPGVYHVARNPEPGRHVLKLQPDRPGVTLHRLVFEPFPAEPAAGPGP